MWKNVMKLFPRVKRTVFTIHTTLTMLQYRELMVSMILRLYFIADLLSNVLKHISSAYFVLGFVYRVCECTKFNKCSITCTGTKSIESVQGEYLRFISCFLWSNLSRASLWSYTSLGKIQSSLACKQAFRSCDIVAPQFNWLIKSTII